MVLTKQQRKALKQVYDRQPIYNRNDSLKKVELPLTYKQFRRTVRSYFGGDCIMVPWCNMWLGIEKDGHTHS